MTEITDDWVRQALAAHYEDEQWQTLAVEEAGWAESDFDEAHRLMRAALAAVAPLIEAQAREKALREAAETVATSAQMYSETRCLPLGGEQMTLDLLKEVADAIRTRIAAPRPKGDGE